MAKASAGLVIRSGSVEVLAVQGKRVTTHARVLVTDDGVEPLTQAVTAAVAQAALPTKRLAVSIGTQDVLFRYFTMPHLPKAEQRAAIQFEARKYVPFKMEGLVWDAATLPLANGKTSARMGVIFAGMQREIFERIQQALEASGVTPVTIEPSSLSLARLIEPPRSPQTAEEFICCVEVEPEVGRLVVVKDRMPFFARDIHLSIRPPDFALPEPALQVEEPMSAEPAGALGDARLLRLLSELSVSIGFFARENPSARITQVVLFGDEPEIRTWCPALAQQLRVPVDTGASWLGRVVDSSASLSAGTAVGLLQSPRGKTASLNLLKRSQDRPTIALLQPDVKAVSSKIVGLMKGPRLAAALTTFVAVLGSWWLIDAQEEMRVREELHQLTAQRQTVGHGLDGMAREPLKALQQKLTQETSFLKQTVDQRVSVSEKLDALARSMPEGVWLTSFSLQTLQDETGRARLSFAAAGACFLGGADQELSAIQEFRDRMKRSPTFVKGFDLVQLGQVTSQIDGPTRQMYRIFQLSCGPDAQKSFSGSSASGRW